MIVSCRRRWTKYNLPRASRCRHRPAPIADASLTHLHTFTHIHTQKKTQPPRASYSCSCSSSCGSCYCFCSCSLNPCRQDVKDSILSRLMAPATPYCTQSVSFDFDFFLLPLFLLYLHSRQTSPVYFAKISQVNRWNSVTFNLWQR